MLDRADDARRGVSARPVASGLELFDMRFIWDETFRCVLF